jgi:O-antigen/teichoic acid export membrane protein
VDIIIGGRYLGVNLLGLYSVALSIASIPLDKVLPAVTQVSFAAFSRIQGERERVVRNLVRGVHLVSLLAFPVFFGIAAVSPDFVPLVLGEKWLEIVPLLQLLCLVLPLKGIASLMAPALYAIGRPGVNVGNTIMVLIAMTVAFAIGVNYGVIGMAGAWVAAYPLVFCIAAARSLRAIGVPLREFIGAITMPAAAAAVMCGAVLGIRTILPDHMQLWLRLAITIVAGIGVYLTLLLPYRDRALAQLRVLWQA